MNVVINAAELRKALADIEIAEKNGFMYCLAVLTITGAGRTLDQCVVEYSDLIEKAHPTDGDLDWGRFQNVSKRYKRCKNGKMIHIKTNKIIG